MYRGHFPFTIDYVALFTVHDPPTRNMLFTLSPSQHLPGQLALAALRSALRGSGGARISLFLERAVAQATASTTPSSLGPPPEKAATVTAEGKEELLTRLLAALDDIDRLGMEGAQKVSLPGPCCFLPSMSDPTGVLALLPSPCNIKKALTLAQTPPTLA